MSEATSERTIASVGAEMIALERKRVIEVEDYDAAHDDAHDGGELWLAAMAYLNPDRAEVFWPFADDYYKPGDRLRELVKAGQFVAAEIDRLLRDAEREKWTALCADGQQRHGSWNDPGDAAGEAAWYTREGDCGPHTVQRRDE